jgi:putative ABC transport system permease protein
MRFYRALLWLYPQSFRTEYAAELCAAFGARFTGRSGVLSTLQMVGAALGDVVPNAAAVHWDILRQDLRYTGRALARSWGFALTAVLVVALGVGANTAAFSLADFVLVRPLPYPDSDRLVKLWHRTPGYGRMELSPPNYNDWRAAATVFSGMAAFTESAVNLVGGEEPRRLQTAQVTPDVFGVVGVRAFRGRTFTREDSAAGGRVVLSHGLWQTQFGGDESVVGQVVNLDGRPHVVVGVMPPGFHFPRREVELWTPLVIGPQDGADRTNNYLQGIARLRPGVSVEQAQTEMTVIAARLEQQYPKENRETGAAVYRLRDEISQRSRLLLVALCGAALCILCLACANLASLLLARAANREQEIAVRTALGAGRDRLLRQLTTESVVLVAMGSAVGLLAAVAGLPLLGWLVPPTLPIAQHPTIDVRVLALAAAIVALTGLAFGVLPALGVRGGKTLAALRDGTRTGGGRKRRTRAALVVVEVTASVVLLVSSGLLIRALWNLESVDPGFRSANVLTLRTALPWPRYDSTGRRAQFYDRVLGEVRSLPGVEQAAYITGLPMAMRGGIWPAGIAGQEVVRGEEHSVSVRFATPQFFTALQIPIRAGRDVSETDGPDQPFVAVVSESFARRYWPNETALGKRFHVAFDDRTIVGVVADVRVRGREVDSEPQVYLPYKQQRDQSMVAYPPKDLVVRSSVPVTTLLPAIRRIVRAVDPQQPISNVRTMDQVVAEETASRVAQLRVLMVLAAIALLIAGVGIHGLLSFSVSRRSQELGIRRALGAQSGAIVGMVMREGVALAAVGIVAGVALAYLAGRAMQALLVGVQPGDPLTIIMAAAVCFGTVLLGCLRPAARAARVDPMAALRPE